MGKSYPEPKKFPLPRFTPVFKSQLMCFFEEGAREFKNRTKENQAFGPDLKRWRISSKWEGSFTSMQSTTLVAGKSLPSGPSLSPKKRAWEGLRLLASRNLRIP